MGTLLLIDDKRLKTADNRRLTINACTWTDDLTMGDDGEASIGGTFEDGVQAFEFSMPLTMFNDRWAERFCNAIQANPGFLSSLSGVERVDKSFVVPAAPGLNGGAAAALARKGGNASFKDFLQLKSGRDSFSAMKLPELVLRVGQDKADAVTGRLSEVEDQHREAETAKALRWMLRGLPLGMAVRKVQVDMEISKNVADRRRK